MGARGPLAISGRLPTIAATSSAVKIRNVRFRFFVDRVPTTCLLGVSISGIACRCPRLTAHFAKRRSTGSSFFSVSRVTTRSRAAL